MKDNFVVKLENVTKKYRLYNKPIYRLWDILGLMSKRTDCYSDHWALNGINLTIRRGERIAIIGRNGAGKSTLLKLISGVIQKTSGNLTVSGAALSLLQIGTGFHLELTGRDNVKAYLLQLGLSYEVLDNMIDEIIDFSELEEYINQPVKTYSTGMVARLMFATSTAVTPDLLILDEILSVGDAYFTKKSMERIDDICKRKNSTMILVSHDIYSAAKLVDRMIWIDAGKVVFDGEPIETLKLYEDSIRAQEESRLRKKSIRQLEKSSEISKNTVLVEFVSKNNIPQNSIIYFSRISFIVDEKNRATIDASNLSNKNKSGVIFESTAVGKPVLYQGKMAFPMLNYNTVNHKAAFYFKTDDKTLLQNAKIEFEYFTENSAELVLNVFSSEQSIFSSSLQLLSKAWYANTIMLQHSNANQSDTLNHTGRFGSGNIVIHEAVLKDRNDNILFNVNFGQFAKLCIDFEVRDPAFSKRADIIITLLKNGVEPTCRFINQDIEFYFDNNKTSRIELEMEELCLGVGEYSIVVMLAQSGYNEQTAFPFYSINPAVYFCGRDFFTFRVDGGGLVAKGAAYVAKGNWKLKTPLTLL